MIPTIPTVVVHYCSIWGEYVVTMYRDGEPVNNATYYTDDKDDAEGTATAMREREAKA